MATMTTTTIRFPDGTTLTGTDGQDLLDRLAREPWNDVTPQQMRHLLVQRAAIWTDTDIDPDAPADKLWAALADAGLVEFVGQEGDVPPPVEVTLTAFQADTVRDAVEPFGDLTREDRRTFTLRLWDPEGALAVVRGIQQTLTTQGAPASRTRSIRSLADAIVDAVKAR